MAACFYKMADRRVKRSEDKDGRGASVTKKTKKVYLHLMSSMCRK